MELTKLNASGFRNLTSCSLTFAPGINVFSGLNGQGKTNLLEAVYICAMGRSWRTKNEREFINFGFPEREAFLYAETSRANGAFNDCIAVNIKRDEKKIINVNKTPVKRLGELLGTLLTVVFTPYDLSLVRGGPSERRKFMDVELCQLNRIYYYELKQYYHILKQRNALLKNIKKDGGRNDALGAWDFMIVGHGIKIMERRAEFIEKINRIASGIHAEISGKKEKLEILYKPNASAKEFLTRLTRSAEKDVFTGQTSVGVHKDELVYLINGQDARIYGSQGQQRLACLSSKLAEIEIIREEKGEDPVLLLDDALSEFDAPRQKYLLQSIEGIQTLMTVTGAESAGLNLCSGKKTRVKRFTVSGGEIAEES